MSFSALGRSSVSTSFLFLNVQKVFKTHWNLFLRSILKIKTDKTLFHNNDPLTKYKVIKHASRPEKYTNFGVSCQLPIINFSVEKYPVSLVFLWHKLVLLIYKFRENLMKTTLLSIVVAFSSRRYSGTDWWRVHFLLLIALPYTWAVHVHKVNSWAQST